MGKANRVAPANFDTPGVYDADTIVSLDRIPYKVVIQGTGETAVEYALVLAMLGTQVVLVIEVYEFMEHMDTCLQETIRDQLQQSNVELLLSTTIRSVVQREGSTPQMPKLAVEVDTKTVDCDMFLSACGRHGNIRGLGIEVLE